MDTLLQEIADNEPRLAQKALRLRALTPQHIQRLESIARRDIVPCERDIFLLGALRDAKYARDVVFCPSCTSQDIRREGLPQDPHPSYICNRCARIFHQCPIHGDNVRGASLYSMLDGTFAVERAQITCTCSSAATFRRGAHLRRGSGRGSGDIQSPFA